MKHIWQFFQIAMVSAIYIQQPSWSGSCYYRSYYEDLVFIIFLVVAQPALTAHGVFLMKFPEEDPQCYTSPNWALQKRVVVHGM